MTAPIMRYSARRLDVVLSGICVARPARLFFVEQDVARDDDDEPGYEVGGFGYVGQPKERKPAYGEDRHQVKDGVDGKRGCKAVGNAKRYPTKRNDYSAGSQNGDEIQVVWGFMRKQRASKGKR